MSVLLAMKSAFVGVGAVVGVASAAIWALGIIIASIVGVEIGTLLLKLTGFKDTLEGWSLSILDANGAVSGLRMALISLIPVIGPVIVTSQALGLLWGTVSANMTSMKRAVSDAWAIIKIVVVATAAVIKSKLSNLWGGITTGLSGAWATIKSVFRNGVNDLIRYLNNGPIKLLNNIIDAAKSIPGVGGSLRRVGIVPYVAAGGMPAMGQMFVAGEAGAELVGSYGGNKSTVMPLENSGFVEAMASAVYAATAAALRTQGDSGTGDVYIDGVKAGAVIKNSTARAGLNGSLVSIGATT
jgi:hypothetical protein